jgi:hypothetical protein
MVTARAWAQPRGHADIAPSRYDRIEGDGYLTVDAPWLVPALLRSVPEISGRILSPPPGAGTSPSNCALPASTWCPETSAVTWSR